MSSLLLNPSNPYLYLTVSGLWSGTALVIYAVAAPPPGQALPIPTHLATITSNGTQSQGLKLPTKAMPDGSLALDCASVRFAVVSHPTDTGAVQVQVRRDQDKPTQPPWDAWPVADTISLPRTDATSPIYTEQEIAVSKDSGS